jgi:hypothetical protein
MDRLLEKYLKKKLVPKEQIRNSSVGRFTDESFGNHFVTHIKTLHKQVGIKHVLRDDRKILKLER